MCIKITYMGLYRCIYAHDRIRGFHIHRACFCNHLHFRNEIRIDIWNLRTSESPHSHWTGTRGHWRRTDTSEGCDIGNGTTELHK